MSVAPVAPMGRFWMEASPVRTAEKSWAARIPEMSRVVVPLFPQEFSQEQEAAIERLVASNSGAPGTPAGDRMAAWNRLVDNWQDRRM